MPQTAGQSSAAYHAEHAVRPAHTSPDDMPKVVVERAPQHATVRIDRQRIQAVIDQAQAEKAARAALAAESIAQPQAQGLPLNLRIAIAIVAGLAVVLGIFLFARPGAPSASPVAAPPPATTVRPPSLVPAPTAPPAPTPGDTSQASTPATTDTVSTPAAPPVTTSPGKRPRGAGTPAPAGSANLGEFKTTFH